MPRLNKGSIIQEDMSKCFVCGTTQGLNTHEIFFGISNRSKSIVYGCYVNLCGHHHNLSNAGVHFDKSLNIKLRQIAQRKFEEIYGHDKFMEVFRKNYLWEEK